MRINGGHLLDNVFPLFDLPTCCPPHLTNVTLDMEDNVLGDACVFSIISFLQNCGKQLSQISIMLQGNPSLASMAFVPVCLHHCMRLRHLRVSAGSSLTDADIFSMGQEIVWRQAMSLHRMEMSFRGTSLTEYGLEALANMVSQIPNLESVWLDVSNTQVRSIRSVERISGDR